MAPVLGVKSAPRLASCCSLLCTKYKACQGLNCEQSAGSVRTSVDRACSPAADDDDEVDVDDGINEMQGNAACHAHRPLSPTIPTSC